MSLFFHYDPTFLVCPLDNGGFRTYMVTETACGPLYHLFSETQPYTPAPQLDAFPATLPVGWPVSEPSAAQSVAESVAESVLDDPEPVVEPESVLDDPEPVVEPERPRVTFSAAVEVRTIEVEPDVQPLHFVAPLSQWKAQLAERLALEQEPSDDWQETATCPPAATERVRELGDQPVCLGTRPDDQPCRHIVGVRPNGQRYPLCMQCRRRNVVGVCLHCDNVVRHQSHLECRACFECRN